LLGRQPTTTDLKNGISKYNLSTFSRRYGGWRDVLKCFIDWLNSENTNNEIENDAENNNQKLIKQEIITTKMNNKHRTSRNINLRLRFKVMLRDNFKCCFCGDSPAKMYCLSGTCRFWRQLIRWFGARRFGFASSSVC
jgi:hypothetical protein